MNILDNSELEDTGIPISQAPRFSCFDSLANTDSELETLMHEESKRLYRAVDSKGGLVLVKNPALLTYQSFLRKTPVRVQPKPLMIEIDKSRKNKEW